MPPDSFEKRFEPRISGVLKLLRVRDFPAMPRESYQSLLDESIAVVVLLMVSLEETGE